MLILLLFFFIQGYSGYKMAEGASCSLLRTQTCVPVQFEGVGTISVGRLFLQVAGKVDDGQRSKRTFLQREKPGEGTQTGPRTTFHPADGTLMQMPQPIHRDSEIQTILL